MKPKVYCALTRFVLAVCLCAAIASADELQLDHHGRWVTAALLAETVTQESATLADIKEAQPTALKDQTLFALQVANKISYQPSVVATSPKSRAGTPSAQVKVPSLPQWQAWTYLQQPAERLKPLCRPTARSLECQSYRAVANSNQQSAVIHSLHQAARDNPNTYSNPTVMAYHALLLLRQKNYPESLRVLFKLQNADPKYKLLYNKIQRVYSLTQKASGDVVLRQSL